tara:strand:- start:160 stop:468 length:309 start_codon:yes stop_codon:yes gene_type:complete
MKLMTKAIEKKLPRLYSTENETDPIVVVKYFSLFSEWTWYGIEFDGKDTFYGLVMGWEKELGYFSLSELESINGPAGIKMVERDLYFKPKRLSEIKDINRSR